MGPTFYGPELLQSMHPNISASSVTLSEGMVYLIPTVSAPLIGMLVDKWGAGKVYMLTVISVASSFQCRFSLGGGTSATDRQL